MDEVKRFGLRCCQRHRFLKRFGMVQTSEKDEVA